MFSKLKDKLKKSLSIFSRKVEDETEEQQKEELIEKKPIEESQPEQSEAAKEPEEEPKPTTEEILKEVEETSETKEKQEVGASTEPEKKPELVCDEEKGICLPPELAKVVEPKKEVKQQPKVKEITDVLGDLKANEVAAEETKKELKEIPSRIETPAKKESAPELKEQQPEVTSEASLETSIEPAHEQPVKKAVKKGFFARAKEALTTRTLSESKFDDFFTTLEHAMLENNVAMGVVDKIKNDLRTELVNKPLPRNIEAIVSQTLKQSIDGILSIKVEDILSLAKKKKPFVITFFGINGSGKTTTIAKIAHLLKKNNLTCVLAAGDTFRAAAIQQLEEHATKLEIKIIKHDYGADAAAVAFDAVKYAQKHNIDVVLVDTAGRLHNDTNLMDELKKVVRVTPPDLRVFVGESITGNDCIEQAQKFNEHIGVDAIILTKADVDEKGGTALSMSYVTHKPIMYIGTGQTYADLQPFTKDVVLDNLGLS